MNISFHWYSVLSVALGTAACSSDSSPPPGFALSEDASAAAWLRTCPNGKPADVTGSCPQGGDAGSPSASNVMPGTNQGTASKPGSTTTGPVPRGRDAGAIYPPGSTNPATGSAGVLPTSGTPAFAFPSWPSGPSGSSPSAPTTSPTAKPTAGVPTPPPATSSTTAKPPVAAPTTTPTTAKPPVTSTGKPPTTNPKPPTMSGADAGAGATGEAGAPASSSPCAYATSDGTWCGSQIGGAANELYTCTGGQAQGTPQTCTSSCVANSGADFCSPSNADPCAGAPEGTSCGSRIGGDASSLYTCSSGMMQGTPQPCANGCGPDPTTGLDACTAMNGGAPDSGTTGYDYCSGLTDGTYCGLGGDINTVYTCAGGVTTSSESCPNGCTSSAFGGSDTCQVQSGDPAASGDPAPSGESSGGADPLPQE